MDIEDSNGKPDVFANPDAEEKRQLGGSKDDPDHEIDLNSNDLTDPPKLPVTGKLTWDKSEKSGSKSQIEDLTGTLNVEILSYEKIGDGMSGYVLFLIRTTTNIPVFRSNEMTVKRRFSDFLGLYQRLQNMHAPKGIIVPRPPEKQNIDSNKYKFVKDAAKENDFLEQRRISLLHFLENLIRHPTLRNDSGLREFLEFDGTLPKATNTQALSGSSATKLLKSVTDAFVKISAPMDDTDEYFYNKTQELNTLERQFTRLMQSFNALASHQAENILSTSVVSLMQNLDLLSTSEQNNRISTKLHRLSEVYDTLSKHEAVRAQAESVYLYDMARGIVAMIQAGKSVLDERLKLQRRQKETEELLSSRRAQKMKLELANREPSEKTTMLEAQIAVTGQKLDELNSEFESMCKTLKEEFKRFNLHRFYDMRASMLAYLEVLLSVQQKNQEAWGKFLQMLESGTF